VKKCKFAGLEHSGIFTQCQGGKTSAAILQKQLLFPINLGRVIRQFPNYLDSIILQRERFSICEENSTGFASKFSATSDRPMFRETAKNPEATSQPQHVEC